MLDPERLNEYPPAEVLAEAARGHLGLDHRFLHAILDRPDESLPAVVEFAARNRSNEAVDLAPELISIFRHWKTPESLPFFVTYLREDPTDIPDEAVQALVELGRPALEPLLGLYGELEEEQSGEIAFILANLRVKDDRILELLLNRLEFDVSDTALLLSVYGDERARGSLEALAVDLTPADAELKGELEDALRALDEAAAHKGKAPEPDEPFDIWSGYPEQAELPIEFLDEDERLDLLATAEGEDIREAAAASFFNQELTDGQRTKLLEAAQADGSARVRGRAWEALMNSTDNESVLEAMLGRLRDAETPAEERAGLVVGLAPETDRNEVREAILQVYAEPQYRAKALEAMWRSMHTSFKDLFAPHLDDEDVEVRRSAIWGVGYFGVKTELDRLRAFFADEELRSDALFAYALALPGETSRGRVQGMLAKVEKDANGLSELEEDLVRAALDERLLLAGKEPVFAVQQD